MYSLNINSSWSITGSNEGEAYWLKSDMEAGNVPTDDPRLKNGFRGIEMDTRMLYLFSESDKTWYPFINLAGGSGNAGV